ncbi:MAG: LytTR family transcriptional regulator [Cytophagales bacterium]|nr:LytTR family transcriptional regulator [Cytophagales bacterium]
MKTLKLPGNKIVFTDQILYLESDSNYTVIHKKDSPKKIITAQSLCYVHESLSPRSFIRINRYQVVNIAQISKYWEEKNTTLSIQLQNGTLFRTSRRRTSKVLNSIPPLFLSDNKK